MDDSIYFYENDFTENPRDSEPSAKVVRSWMNCRVRYAVEDIADPRCLRIVAERLLVRRILGLGGLDAAYAEHVASVRVFGGDSPSFVELTHPHAFVAMAFVPLTPKDKEGSPCLARLYCVGGLRERHRLPLDGNEEPELQAMSWFLEGLPPGKSVKDVSGRSWMLAAHLLTRVVTNHDVRTARNLMSRYIVTGDVREGVIDTVEILRKAELERQFPTFKWIIPKENNMNIPTWKIEKPKSLEEAYRIIECMQSVATQSLFRFLRAGNLDGVKEQYRIGANLFEHEEGTGLSCLEIVHNVYEAQTDDEGKAKMAKIANWLRAQKADCAMMFYILAANGDADGIEKTSKDCPINAIDEFGRTAVDWALINDNLQAAKLLHKFGGTPNPRWQANERLKEAMESFCSLWYDKTETSVKLITEALDCGLSPETPVEVEKSPDPNDHERRMNGSLFAAAVYLEDLDVIDACLRNGADANACLELTRPGWPNPFSYSGESVGDELVWHGTATEVLAKRVQQDK